MRMFPDQSDRSAADDLNPLQVTASILKGFFIGLFILGAINLASESDYQMYKDIEEYVCERYPRTADYCREGENNG